MSASNWSICPKCIKLSKDIKDSFVKKYYGKLDSYLYGDILSEIDKAIEHMESYSEKEYTPNKKILDAMQEKDITVSVNNKVYDYYQILWSECVSTCVREDYEQGVDKEGYVYFYYSCNCEYCDLNKDIKFNEKEHKILKRN